MSDSNEIKREDYEEPACPFCVDQYANEPPKRPIPVRRVIDKLGEYLDRNDVAGAERHLLYWEQEALHNRDTHGLFTVRNELMGFYRKAGDREKAMKYADEALSLGEKLGILDRESGATALVNAATVCKAFGEPERSLELFERARPVYESEFAAGDWKLGGLYNNMALTLADLGRYAESRELYRLALDAMSAVENSACERAITWLNLANLAEAQLGLEDAAEEIEDCLEKAIALFDDPSLARDGTYAYYCKQSAPTFRYYGRFADAADLESRAAAIYASNDV